MNSRIVTIELDREHDLSKFEGCRVELTELCGVAEWAEGKDPRFYVFGRIAKASTFEQRRRDWSRRTFGDRGPVGPLKHLRREVDEVIAAWESGDRAAIREEFADCGHLLRDALDRAGISQEEHQADLEAKLAINEAREWPPAVEGEPCEHVREDDVTWPLGAAKHDIVSSAVKSNYDGYITYTLNGRKVSRREYLRNYCTKEDKR